MAIIEKHPTNQKIGAWPGEIPVENLYTAGQAGQKFCAALKERGELLASVCPRCQVAILPPQIFCEQCFSRCEDFRPVGPRGTLHSFTRSHFDLDGEPLDHPITVGMVVFDGVRGCLIHRLLLDDGEVAEIGDDVEVVVMEKARRTGSILDIEGLRRT